MATIRHRTGLLAKARNALGPLAPDLRARILDYLNAPSAAGWDGIVGLVIWTSPVRTIWQAVCKVDPTFPKKGAASADAPPETQWPRYPDALLLARAIKAATTSSPGRVAKEH